MQPPQFLIDLTFEQGMMIVLTIIIAISVLVQAVYTSKQARILAESEQRNRERSVPTVKITPVFHTVQDGDDEFGNPNWKSFVGLTIANASPFDITITSIEFEQGIPIDSDSRISTVVWFPHVTRYKDSLLSNVSLPHRLQYGQTLQVMFDEAHVVEELKLNGGGTPVRVRPRCFDSLGNKHTMDSWIVWEESKISSFPGPGPGYMTEEKWRERVP